MLQYTGVNMVDAAVYLWEIHMPWCFQRFITPNFSLKVSMPPFLAEFFTFSQPL